MFDKSYIPEKPFPEFKWKWACLQCTESLNDPVILLGVLFRMRKLEGQGLKYSSPEFANELIEQYGDEMKKDAWACRLCGGSLRKINGPYGDFYGCTNYRTNGYKYRRKVN